MNSYGYKIPGLQDRVARQRQSLQPGAVFDDPSVEDIAPAVPEPAAPSTPPPAAPQVSLSPREFFESQILPQVREAIGEYGVQNAYAAQQRENSERANLRRIEEADREALDRLRGTPVPTSVQLPEPISYRGLASADFQPGIPGLFSQVSDINDELEQLRSQRAVEAFNNLLTKYPELNKVLYTEPNLQGKASRIRKAGFQPYLDYVDTEQVFSSPEDRAALYNQILSDVDSLISEGLSSSDVADALREAEAGYTSGDTSRQAMSREFLQSILRDPEDLNRIETLAFRENRPVIGGGGYVPVQGNSLVEKINRRAQEFNNLYSQLNFQDKEELAKTFPGLQPFRGKSGGQEGFYLDPDTKEVSLAEFDDPEA